MIRLCAGSPQHPDGNVPLRGYKGSVWEGGYREPGIAWWPGKIKPGTSSNALVATCVYSCPYINVYTELTWLV